MTIENVSETLKRELPALLRDDPDLRRYILELTRGEYAERQQTEDRFDRILEELRRDREAQERKWEESRADFQRIHKEIMALAYKHERYITAVGARWGLHSEVAFRNALAEMLEKNFNMEVIRVNEYDKQGEVYGRPDQIELDVIVKDDLLLICELRSYMTKGSMYFFERKARFYERRHGRKADRLIVISPMIENPAERVAKELGIDTYSDSSEVEEI